MAIEIKQALLSVFSDLRNLILDKEFGTSTVTHVTRFETQDEFFTLV